MKLHQLLDRCFDEVFVHIVKWNKSYHEYDEVACGMVYDIRNRINCSEWFGLNVVRISLDTSSDNKSNVILIETY